MKKYWTIVFTLLLTLALSVCSGKPDTNLQQDAASTMQFPETQKESDVTSIPHDYVQGKFDTSLFAGKVKSCAYAGDDKTIVF